MFHKPGSILLFMNLVSILCFGQDAEFSQIYPGILRLNPAFAGTGEGGRVSGIYRNEWPGINSAYNTTGMFYDIPVDFVHGGIGIQLFNDNQGGNRFRWSSASFIYSYHLQATKNVFVLAGFQASLNQWNRSLKDLVFPDMIDNISGPLYQTSENLAGNSRIYPDFSIGFVANYKDLVTGISIDHLAKPDISISDTYKSNLSRKWAFFIQNSFRFSGSWDGLYLSPGVFYKYQSGSNFLKYGITAGYDIACVGLWIKHDHSFTMNLLTLGLALEVSGFGFGYSYDVSPWNTGLPVPFTGAHEFSLSINFSQNKKNRNSKTINLSKF